VGGEGSGGHNRRSLAAHLRRGTYRPDRHARPAMALPPEIRDDVLGMVRQLSKLAHRELRRAAKSRKGADRAVNTAIKCLRATLSLTRGLGEAATPPPTPNRLDAHLARRATVVRLPTSGERNP
jgi:hypothetical protein